MPTKSMRPNGNPKLDSAGSVPGPACYALGGTAPTVTDADLALGRIDPKSFAAQLNPTVDQLKAFFAQPANAKQFTMPEKADVEYVVLDVDSLKSQVTVNEDDLRRSYQENIAHYTTAEERRASHILIKAEKSEPAAKRQAAKAKAEQLLAELRKNPGEFAELAKRNSDDEGSAANGGDLDYFGRGAMVKPFEEVAFALKKGEVTTPIILQEGCFLLYAEDRKYAGFELKVGPHQGVEYKYRLEKGEALLYVWSATAPVDFDFHAEPDSGPKGYAQTYEKASAARQASGTMTAPFSGIHGWYWLNTTDQEATITLRSAGFYNISHEFRDGMPTKNKMFQ